MGWAGTHTDPDVAGGWFLRLLAWPAWRFDSDDSGRGVFAADLRAILLVVLAAALPLPAARLAGGPGAGLGQPVLLRLGRVRLGRRGFAALLAALLGPTRRCWAPSRRPAPAPAYGFFAGWIIGTASLGGRA